MNIDFSVDEGVATVRLNRPEALNAIDYPMRERLQHLWRHIGSTPEIRAVIVTGAGERAFSSGADLRRTPPPATSFAAQTFGGEGAEPEAGSLTLGLDFDTPTICAFNGLAYGGGLEIGLACDIRIAADTARFALPEVCVGSMPGSGGTQRLPRLIGSANAMWMLLTGESIDAQAALRIGLVSHVVAPDALLGTATGIARRIADAAPLAVRAIKRAARDGLDMPLPIALTYERQTWGLLRDTEDRKEGREAFAQKRTPVFRGR
ncbi:enoyl-CoA hydratase/isomerase family protein [Paraburkholderia susongensis]|uniref:Enoyl-CoA hydratase/carnithine racemase n=1 Tax=Paraburkholderia susongensis TaxID=1515439 RepID=A0A1X7I2G7_9BURK|nr:enoyl-CoA hydratase-related protein [Paraburkholderia susongensis]SMG08545.1 Enoyl-CoA hydratase/carnithine racemase [Paraburkholderia susongensis]